MEITDKWNVVVGDGSYGFLVTASNERDARKAAREWLKVSRLPSGTKLWQVPPNPWNEEE